MFEFFVVSAIVVAVHGRITCNRTNLADLKNSIVNGEDANEGEFPFMVSLRVADNNKHFCGGTILTKNWVMSAAHCCLPYPHPRIVVVPGSLYLDRGGVNHTVDQVIIHERFNESCRYCNDICVIRVKNPFTFDANVQKVVLPKKDFPLESGDNLTGIGWGLTNRNNSVLPNRLQKADEIIVITNEECDKRVHIKMFPGYLCTVRGIKQQTTCRGDSGGPVLKNGIEVGITSFLIEIAGKATDFYTRVTHYIDWIKRELGPDAADLKFSE